MDLVILKILNSFFFFYFFFLSFPGFSSIICKALSRSFNRFSFSLKYFRIGSKRREIPPVHYNIYKQTNNKKKIKKNNLQ
jgi:hypothetical protein